MKRLFLAAMTCVISLFAFGQSYSIYPIPQTQNLQDGTVSLSSTVNIVCESGIDNYTKDRIKSILSEAGVSAEISSSAVSGMTNIYLGVNGSNEVADNLVSTRGLNRTVFGKTDKYDKHLLSLRNQDGQAELIVLGENTDATFMGLATFEQMLDNGTENLRCVNIYDYADQQSRGLVEGYYGYPYSVSVKKDIFKFMMRYKMNTYLYGAKSDPYHSNNWKDAYPVSITEQQEKNGWLSQNMVKELTEEAHKTKVNFIWAIHPGNNFLNSSTVVNDIMAKFDLMYKLGVRQFAIFVDDVGIPNSESGYALNAERLNAVQQAIEQKYNKSTAAPADTVKPLHFVPQIYCTTFSSSEEQRQGFFTALANTPQHITIYTTGWGVWSIPNSSDLNQVKKYLGRNVGWWWNYPCNDNADGQIYTKDMYSNFYDMPSVSNNGSLPATLENGIGIVSNPMQEGELSKIALFSVADYAWNTAKFVNSTSYKAAVKAVVGKENAEDFEFLADYLRYNDPSDFSTMMNSSKSAIQKGISNTYLVNLKQRLERINTACDKFIAFETSEKESDRLFYQDIAPWLQKLKTMTSNSLKLIEVSQTTGDRETRWNEFIAANKELEAIYTDTKYIAYALEGMGSGISVSQRVSQPSELYFKKFVAWLQEYCMDNYFENGLPTGRQAVTNLTGNEAKAVRAMYATTTNSYYLNITSTVVLNKGNYIGIKLPDATKISSYILNDTLLANYTVKVSENFKTWRTITSAEELKEGFIKYIIFENDGETPKTMKMSARTFSVTPSSTAKISQVEVPSGGNASGTSLSSLTDGDYTSWWSLNRNQATGDAYVLTLEDTTRLSDVRVCFGTVNNDYPYGAKVQFSTNKTDWKDLKIKGTNTTTFTISNANAVKFNDEMTYCDFDGEDQAALYVRLYVSSANTSKWLRLFEIEVNKHSLVLPVAEDANGNGLFNLYDSKASTKEGYGGSPITYHFMQDYKVAGVCIYQDASVGSNASASVTTDGSSWTRLGKCATANIQIIDLTGYNDASDIKIAWTGTAPSIYEIEEYKDTSEVTAIKTFAIISDAPSWKNGESFISVSGNSKLKNVELYAPNGQLIRKTKLNGAREYEIAKSDLSGGVVIVKLTREDGSVFTRKFIVR